MNSKLAHVSAAIQGSEQNAGDSVVAKWSQLREQPLCAISEDYHKTIISLHLSLFLRIRFLEAVSQ